jgi:hypothetical protein
MSTATLSKKNGVTIDNNEAMAIRFFPGDLVQMYDTCNGEFDHSVLPDMVGGVYVSILLTRVLQWGENVHRSNSLIKKFGFHVEYEVLILTFRRLCVWMTTSETHNSREEK